MVEKNNSQEVSRDQIINYLKEQIEVRELQVKLQELNTKMAVLRLNERNAIMQLADLQNVDETERKTYTLTEEDIKQNPELKEEGLKAGDKIVIPSDKELKEEKEPTQKKKGLKVV